MSSVILRPNGTAVGNASGGWPLPTIVGSGVQLGDQSDATYVTPSSGTAPGATNWVDAAYEPFTGDPATVTSVVAHARLSSTAGGTPSLRWLSSAVTFTHPILLVESDMAIPGGGGVVEVSATVADVASGTYYSTWSMFDAATFLTASDVYVEVHQIAGDITVHDVWLEVVSLSPCFQTLTATFDSAYTAATTANAPDDVVLRDGNPATYVTTSTTADSPVEAYLNLYTGPTAVDLSVSVTAAGAAANVSFDAQIISGRGNIPHILISTPLLTVPAGSASTTYTYTFTDADYAGAGYTLADIAARLAGSDPDTALDIQVHGLGLMVSEASVRVGHKCYVLNPLRRWPGGEGTGPTRVWPRRITRRPGTY